MATDVAVRRLIDQFSTQNGIVRQRVLDFVSRQWGGLTSWRDADIQRFVDLVVPVVEAGQLQVAALTDAYLAGVETMVRGAGVAPLGVASEVVNDLAIRGVATADVYARTGPTVWTALANGADLAAATQAALDRVLVTAQADLQLAHTHAARDILTRKPQVVGHRRVLTGAKSCRLCVTASTQRYTKAELAPIHGRCDCKVLPIYGDADPGRTINAELLDELKRSGNAGDLALTQSVTRGRKQLGAADERLDAAYAARERARQAGEGVAAAERRVADLEAAQRRAKGELTRRQDQLADYRGENGTPKTVIVHNHGEMGPMLTDRQQHFTGPGDLR